MFLGRLMRALIIVCCISVAHAAAVCWAVTVNGITYEVIEGNWHVYDSHGVEWEIAPNVIEVKFEAGVSAAQIDTFLTNHDLVDVELLLADGWHQFTYDLEEDPLDVLVAVFASPIVADAWLDTFGKYLGTPNDMYFDQQWDLSKMDLERAWDVDFGSAEVTIAVIDDGIFPEHEDLNANIWLNAAEYPPDGFDDDNDFSCYGAELIDDYWGWNFDGNDNAPTPKGLHGTACAGVAAATRNNQMGVAGVAGTGGIRLVSLVASKASQHTLALKYCRCKNLDIVSISMAFEERPSVNAELDLLFASGTLIFAASGNGGIDCDTAFPARHPNVVGVGATDEDDVRWSWSCYDVDGVDLVAPAGDDLGVGPFTTTTDNYGPLYAGYNDPPGCDFDCFYNDKFGGTSAACPAAAGVAALLLAHNPALSNEEIRDKMFRAAKDLGSPGEDDEYGFGRVDAYRTVTEWGVIESNTTWGQQGTVYVSGDVTVAAGVTLTILPGTTVKVADNDNEHAGADDDKVEFNVEGELVADGTEAAPITFESWTEESSEDWVGFYFDSDSDGALFDNCIIRHAEYGIETYVDLTVKNTDFEDCRFAGIAAQDGALLVHGCVMTDPAPTWGIFLTAADATVRNTVIDNATSAAIHVQANATLALRNSILRNSDKGVYSNTSYVTIDSTCVLGYNNIGIHCYGTSPSILRSSIDHNSVDGVMCDNGGSPAIQYCTFTYNYVGVYCVGSTAAPVLRRNSFSNNTGAVNADVGANPDVGDVNLAYGYNTFNSTNSYFVANANAWTVMAEGNFWAKTTPPCLPNPTKIIGDVDVSPALCSNPNPSAPGPGPGPEPVASTPIGIVSTSPNPFNPAVVIRFGLPKEGSHVEMRIYDVDGKLVRELVDERRDGGLHDVVWDGTNIQGEPVASSVYFVRMAAGSIVNTRKIVLLK